MYFQHDVLVFIFIPLMEACGQADILMSLSNAGVEKNNDESKRAYYYSNRHDPAADILKTKHRLEVLKQTCTREKRSYEKDEGYWFGGGIQQKRKRHRPEE